MDLEVRLANDLDSSIIYAWRNEPRTRSSSRSSHIISREEHDAWFTSSLANKNLHLFIVELDAGTPIGTVRFDRERENVFEVSVTVSPLYRGQGLGAAVLLSCEASLLLHFSSALLRAFIKPGNSISVKLFESCEYVNVSNGWWEKTLEANA